MSMKTIIPFEAQFYIVKLGCKEVYIYFCTKTKNVGTCLMSTHYLCLKQKNEKLSIFSMKIMKITMHGPVFILLADFCARRLP